MTGAPGTLYANETYQLQVEFPVNYPMEAPQACHLDPLGFLVLFLFDICNSESDRNYFLFLHVYVSFSSILFGWLHFVTQPNWIYSIYFILGLGVCLMELVWLISSAVGWAGYFCSSGTVTPTYLQQRTYLFGYLLHLFSLLFYFVLIRISRVSLSCLCYTNLHTFLLLLMCSDAMNTLSS